MRNSEIRCSLSKSWDWGTSGTQGQLWPDDLPHTTNDPEGIRTHDHNPWNLSRKQSHDHNPLNMSLKKLISIYLPDLVLYIVVYFRLVCWDLYKRGAVGETLIHTCLLLANPLVVALAKRLLSIFPKLLVDIYLSDQYYGGL